MAKFEIVEEVAAKARGGFGAGAGKDESDDLADMNYAEKIVLNKEFLEALATLKVVKEETKNIEGKDTKVKTGGFIRLTKEDILEYRNGETIEMNGVAHKVNQEFVALEIPFYAQSFATDEAEKVEVTGKRGKKVGKTYNKTVADRLQIYRISDAFNTDNYASAKSKRVLEDGVNDYNEPTIGMRLRAEKWIAENGEDIVDTLKAIGIVVDEE